MISNPSAARESMVTFIMPHMLPAAMAQAWPMPPEAPIIRMREDGPRGEDVVMAVKINGIKPVTRVARRFGSVCSANQQRINPKAHKITRLWTLGLFTAKKQRIKMA